MIYAWRDGILRSAQSWELVIGWIEVRPSTSMRVRACAVSTQQQADHVGRAAHNDVEFLDSQ